jgi:iron complex outermembrane recepter protein
MFRSKLVTLIILNYCQLFAQQDTIHTTLKDTTYLEEVIISDKKQFQNELSATQSTLSVNKDFLLQHQGNTLMNTLDRLPGISTIQTGVGISKPVIRGMSFNRVIVNEFGIKQEGQQWGADHGLELDQYNAEEIEIVKGPVSLMYGSDGIGGVINVVKPAFPKLDIVKAGVISSFKSNNNNWGTSVSFEKQKKGIWLKTRFSHQQFGDYKVPATEFNYNRFKLPILDNKLKNTAGNENDYALLLGIKKGRSQTSVYLSIYNQKAGLFAGAFGIPRAYKLQHDGDYRDIQLPRQEIQHLKVISNTLLFLKKRKFELDFGYQRNLRHEHAPPHIRGVWDRNTNTLGVGLLLQTFSYQIKTTNHLNSNWAVTIGSNGSYQTNQITGYEFLIPNFRAYQGGVYLLSNVAISKNLTWLLGARADGAKQTAEAKYLPLYAESNGELIDYNKRSPYLNKNYIMPSFSSGLSYVITKKWQLKYNIGTAFRIPAIAELAANGVHHGTFRHEMGDSTLKPEKGIMNDLAIIHQAPKLKLEASPFFYYFQNYIYLRPSGKFSTLVDAGQIYQYQQGRTRMTGFEALLDYKINNSLNYHFSAEYVRNLNLDAELPLPFTPPLSLLNELEFKKKIEGNTPKQVFATLSSHYFAAQNRTDRNEPATEGYLLFNASFGSTFYVSKHELKLQLQVRNLRNIKYLNNMSRYRILNLPEQGRNFVVMLSYNIND